MIDTPRPRFDLGQIVATPGAVEALDSANQSPSEYLQRHAAGDWGVVPAEDARANDAALVDGSRLLSAYQLPDGARIWVITEAADEAGQRSATTILLPEEY